MVKKKQIKQLLGFVFTQHEMGRLAQSDGPHSQVFPCVCVCFTICLWGLLSHMIQD